MCEFRHGSQLLWRLIGKLANGAGMHHSNRLNSLANGDNRLAEGRTGRRLCRNRRRRMRRRGDEPAVSREGMTTPVRLFMTRLSGSHGIPDLRPDKLEELNLNSSQSIKHIYIYHDIDTSYFIEVFYVVLVRSTQCWVDAGDCFSNALRLASGVISSGIKCARDGGSAFHKTARFIAR
jgi:hypothetical protein